MDQRLLTLRTLTLVVAVSAVIGGTVAVVGPIAADSAGDLPAVVPGDDAGDRPATASGDDSTTSADDPTTAQEQSLENLQESPRNQSPSGASKRIDFLEIRALDDGEYAYQFRVRGYVQRARVNDQVKSEANDKLQRNDNGTVTVTGTTGNGLSDAYVIVGEIVSYQQTESPSDGELTLNGLDLSVDELLNTETVEVLSRDEDEEISYEILVRGSVERVETGEDVAGDEDDRISRNENGTVTIRGVTDDQDGDAFRVRGEVLSFRQTGGDSQFRLRLDGLDVDPDTLEAGVGNFSGAESDDGDEGNDETEGDDTDDSDTDDATDTEESTDTDDATDTETSIDDDTDAPETETADPVDDDNSNDTETDDDNSTDTEADDTAATDTDDANDTDDVNGTDNDATDSDAVTRITECTRIDEPGQYVLTQDISDAAGGTCLEVQASDVIVDGDDHRIDGADAGGSVGIGVSAVDDGTVANVSVRNVDLSNWDTGVRASSRQGGSVSDVTVEGVTSASNVGFGVHLVEVDGGEVDDVTTRENGASGILMEEPGPQSAVVDSRADSNDGYGVVVFDASHGTVVRGNQVMDNGGIGIATSNGDEDTVIQRNTVTGNGGAGISLSDSSTATVRDNVVRTNDGAGLLGDDVRDATVVGNEILENGAYGMELGYVDRAEVRDNEVRGNGDSGVFLDRSTENVIVRNVVCGNDADLQIREDADSSGNEIRNNTDSC